MYTNHGHWFPPHVPGEFGPLTIQPCGGLAGCAQCGGEALALRMAQGPSDILTTPAPTVPAVASSMGVLEVPVDELTDWYQRYLEAKDAEAKIKEVVSEARATFLDALNRRYAELPDKVNMTIKGKPVLQRQVVVQNRVDTTRLRTEQPALAKQYSKEVRQERLNIL